MFDAPLDYEERVQVVSDTMNEKGIRKIRVSYKNERYSDRSSYQLKPSVVDLESLIKAGTFIEPGNLTNYFAIHDMADIDNLDGKLSEDMYKYLLDRKDDIVEFLNNNKS